MSRAGLYNSAISSFLLLLLLPLTLPFLPQPLGHRRPLLASTWSPLEHPPHHLCTARAFSSRWCYLFIASFSVARYRAEKAGSSPPFAPANGSTAVRQCCRGRERNVPWENAVLETITTERLRISAAAAPRRKGEHPRVGKEGVDTAETTHS